VLLASGAAIPISQLKAGDKVLATNTKTGKMQAETVKAVILEHDNDLYDLTVKVGGRTAVIQTTQHHRFWDQTTRRWTFADALGADDLLRTPGRAKASVVSGQVPASATGWMWDLTIAHDHDFYIDVATTAVLVHNCPSGSRFSPNAKAKIGAQNAGEDGVNTCESCGQDVVPPDQSQPGVSPPGNEGQVDHIFPRSLGGNGVLENGQLLCRVCNLLKGNQWPWP
jgi:hypothetical protein